MKLTYKNTKYACYLGSVTQAIVNNLVPLLLVIFQKDFGISFGKIGFLVSINFVIQIVVDFLAAKYVDRIGYRKCIVAAHMFCTLGLVGLGIFPYLLSDPYAGLLIAVVINAVGSGLIEVLTSPIVEALPGKEKASAMSLLHSFYCWGHVGVVILSTLFFNIIGLSHWRYLSILWAAVPFFNVLLFAKVPLKALVEEGSQVPLRKLFRVKIFWMFFILMLCSGAAEQAMSQWSSLFAETGLKVSKTLGDLFGPCAFAVLMGISRTVYGLTGSKLNLKKVIGYSGLLCIVSYMIAVFAPFPLLGLAGCALCGLSVGIMWPGVLSISAKRYPQGGTAMFAILALAGDLGCSAGPGVVGFISGITDNLKSGLLAAAVFPAVLVICLMVMNASKPNASKRVQ